MLLHLLKRSSCEVVPLTGALHQLPEFILKRCAGTLLWRLLHWQVSFFVNLVFFHLHRRCWVDSRHRSRRRSRKGYHTFHSDSLSFLLRSSCCLCHAAHFRQRGTDGAFFARLDSELSLDHTKFKPHQNFNSARLVTRLLFLNGFCITLRAFQNHKNKTWSLEKLVFHWFSFPSFCFKNVSWHDMQTKNFQQLQPECQHVGLHVHYRNYSQTAKSPKRVQITSLVNIVQQCSPVAHDKDWPKNRDGKGQDTVTENRKTPANHPDGTTEVLKVHIPRFATKEQYKVKTVGRDKDLQ